MPSREDVRRFAARTPGRVGKREVAREFGLGPEHRIALRELLKTLERDGELARAGNKRFLSPGRLPEQAVVVVTGTDADGDAVARPLDWTGPGAAPVIFMHPELRGRPALAPGQRVLARLKPIGTGRYEGRTLKRLESRPGRVLGQFRPVAAESEPYRRGRIPEAGRIVPTDKRNKAEWSVPDGETGGAEEGEIVLAEPLPQMNAGLKPVRVVERLGMLGDARSVSLICIHTHDIPHEFPPECLAAAEEASPIPLGDRTDLRAIPLVTIDGEDARDFDDAVFAEPDPDHPGGWRLVVAIADVAHYVRPGTPLDREARLRGNSVYFPDRVVPMLPEALSNGWCSLKPGEPRGCLFAEIRIAADGARHAHRFGRGLMQSTARLTYEQVQDARDGTAPLPVPLPDGLLDSLYGAFAALQGARDRRGTLDLDLPERKVVIENGAVRAILPRARLDSHRLIEEFMVVANVAAALELERLRQPLLYRVHAPPSPEKIEALRDVLDTLGLSLKPAGALRPADLDAILRKVADTPDAPLVNECVLRAQSQAEYSPENQGHFGLALAQYAHFTSPIRRYADLCVHRALIAGLRLGDDSGGPADPAALEDAGEHITATERRAALAERDAVDRYIAAHMADKIGVGFSARISGVTRFGLFVTLPESGATGLVPIASLSSPDDDAGEFWMHDESARALVGRISGRAYRLADTIGVRLVEAAPLTGGLLFALDHPVPNPSQHRGRRS
ncbi:ribonuclease R [Acetobacteraceae bacterium KSS8]|uniref:Ribonuclease R n=1 Tax=Endosaccharibacter trunci TaxID=2812733 RepID=A0ABT1W9D7_9PROT|nr:ribonuclease R [Acetobacteraceae bacterium KSS8]